MKTHSRGLNTGGALSAELEDNTFNTFNTIFRPKGNLDAHANNKMYFDEADFPVALFLPGWDHYYTRFAKYINISVITFSFATGLRLCYPIEIRLKCRKGIKNYGPFAGEVDWFASLGDKHFQSCCVCVRFHVDGATLRVPMGPRRVASWEPRKRKAKLDPTQAVV